MLAPEFDLAGPKWARADAEAELLANPEPAERQLVVTGRWLKTARIFDEAWLDLPPIENPAAFLESTPLPPGGADLFTFAQDVFDPEPRFDYPLEYDSLAVADTADYPAWWSALPHESRKNVRKALKRGLTVHPVPFSLELAARIKAIYDEMPVRQGRRFWHYGKPLETVARENASYLRRSQFLAACFGDELIGFIKIVFLGQTGRIMQILSRARDAELHPTNALLAAAVHCCAARSVRRLIYGQYVYGRNHGSSVTEFKRRNLFCEVSVPRYYVPLSRNGRWALAAGLQQGLDAVVPESVRRLAARVRRSVLDLTLTDRPARSSSRALKKILPV